MYVRMTQKQIIIDQIAQKFIDAKNILFTAGENFDGDAYGSLLALNEVAYTLGKNTKIVNSWEIDPVYSFLLDDGHNRVETTIADFIPDLIIITDTGDIPMLWQVYRDAQDCFRDAFIINIDHHATNTHFGQLNLIDTAVSSACELVAQVIEAILPETKGACFSRKLSSYLMLWVFYDTNCFRNENTNYETFAFMSRLLSCGACYFPFIKHLYRSRDAKDMKFFGHLLDHSITYGDNGAIGVIMSREIMQKYGVHSDWLASTFNNEFLSTIRSDFSFVIKECESGVYKLSFRTSKDGYNVANLAMLLGGGGHIKAAGAMTDRSLDEILSTIESYYFEHANI